MLPSTKPPHPAQLPPCNLYARTQRTGSEVHSAHNLAASWLPIPSHLPLCAIRAGVEHTAMGDSDMDQAWMRSEVGGHQTWQCAGRAPLPCHQSGRATAEPAGLMH